MRATRRAVQPPPRPLAVLAPRRGGEGQGPGQARGRGGDERRGRDRPREHVRRDHALQGRQGGEGPGRSSGCELDVARSAAAGTATTSRCWRRAPRGTRTSSGSSRAAHVKGGAARDRGDCVALEGPRRDDGVHGRPRVAGHPRRGRGARTRGARDAARRARAGQPVRRAPGPRPPGAADPQRDPRPAGARSRLPLVATNDVHYAERSDAEAHSTSRASRRAARSRRRRSATTARARCT